MSYLPLFSDSLHLPDSVTEEYVQHQNFSSVEF